MKFGKLELALLVVFNLLIASPAFAQWQVPDHSVPIGRGSGIVGFKYAAPGAAGMPFSSAGGTADPGFFPISSDNVLYTAPFTGGVQKSQSVYNAQWLYVTGFGAVADAKTTASDNGPALRRTWDAAALHGLGVKIPGASDGYGVTTCRNNAVFDGTSLTAPNGNVAVSIEGDGWNEKPFASPTGSWILPNSAFPSNCSWVLLSGSDKVSSPTYRNFGIGEFGGSLGTPKGLNGFFVSAANPAFWVQGMTIDHVYIGNMATGKSIQITAGSTATPGGISDSLIINSKFMSFNTDYLGDHVTLAYNTIGQNATIDARNVGVEFANCSGCTSTTIVGGNISNFNGMVVVHGANKLVIRDVEMEMSAGFTNTRGAMVDLVGDVSIVEAFTVTGSQMAQDSLVGDYAPVKVQNAISGQIYDNRIGLSKATPYDYVTMTGSASGTFMGYNRCSYANATSTVTDFACTVSSLGGAYGFQHTPFGFSLPGSTDGRVTVNTQAHAGTTALVWPTVNGTLASAGLAPIVVTVAGVITCPSCATTGGTSVPSVVAGDILYGSAPNVLSALTGVAVGNVLLSGATPSWGKVNFGTHMTGTLLATNAPAFVGGDVTSSAGSLALALVNIPTGIPVAGTMLHSNIAAPSSPASGKVLTWTDSTDLRFHDKNSAGVIGTTVVADTGAANNYISAISPAGAVTKSRPSCATLSDASVFCNGTSAANLTGTILAAQEPARTGDLTNSAGSTVLTFNTVNTNVGSFSFPTFTVNAKGLITAASSNTAVTSITCNGLAVTATGTCPEPLDFENCSFTASVAANILTVALKDGAGSNPSATSPCRVGFASATASTGTSTFNSVTGALSIDTNATGASLGTLNSTAFRFWVVAFDNSGTTVLSLYNASTATTGCSPIDESSVQSSTAMSGSATAAKTYYTPNGTTISSKSIRLLGFVEYGSSGLATAGTYASAPAIVRTFTKGMKRACDEVQLAYGEAVSTTSSSTSNAFGTGAAPVNSPIATITPKSAANLVHAIYASTIQTNSGSSAVAYCQLHRGASGSVNTAIGSLSVIDTNVAGSTIGAASGQALDAPNVSTAIQYALRVRNSDNATTVSCPTGNGTANIVLKEIQG